MKITLEIEYPMSAEDAEALRRLLPTSETAPGPETPAEPEKAAETPPEAGETPPTLEDAIDRATELVETGKDDRVKAALVKVRSKRVSTLEPDQIEPFLRELAQ